MSDFATELALALVRTTVYTSFAAILVWMTLHALRCASPSVHRTAWTCVLLQAWILFPWTIQVPVQRHDSIDVPSGNPVPQLEVPLPASAEMGPPFPSFGSHAEKVSTPPARSPGRRTDKVKREPMRWTDNLTWGQAFSGLWVGGIVFWGGLYFARYARFVRRVPFGNVPARAEWADEWAELLEQRRVRSRVYLRITDAMGPLLCFIPFFYMVLVPRRLWEKLDRTERLAILRHELAHFIRGDLWKSFFIRLLALPQWFNPAAWWAVQRFDEATEWACDDAAKGLAQDEHVSYANALLRMTELIVEPCPGTVGIGGGRLSRRVQRLVRTCYREDSRMKRVIVYLLLFGLTVTHGLRLELVAQETPPAKVDETAAKQQRIEELREAGLEPYRIDPPDILSIDLIRVEPNAGYALWPRDVVQIAVTSTNENENLVGRFKIDEGGTVEWSKWFKPVLLAGLTCDEAAQTIADKLARKGVASPTVSVTVVQLGLTGIEGPNLVTADGRINLGRFGQVYVAGLTVKEAQKRIDTHLSRWLDERKVKVRIKAINSEVVYVIDEGSGKGDYVHRIPITGSETFLDAVARTRRRSNLSERKIWIARPAVGRAGGVLHLSVDYKAISTNADTSTNYHLLPGDRIFIASAAKNPGTASAYQGPVSGGKETDKEETSPGPAPPVLVSRGQTSDAERHLAQLAKDLKFKLSVLDSRHNQLIAARQEAEAGRDSYAAGNVTLDRLLDAQRRLHDARVAYVRSLVGLRSELGMAQSENLLAMFKLAYAKDARDSAKEVWRGVRQARDREKQGGEAESEAQARAQYFFFRSVVEDATKNLDEAQKAVDRIEPERSQQHPFPATTVE